MRKSLFFFIPIFLAAGTAGKISGRIVDVETIEPLCGVDVYIAELTVGGATDADGFFYILNIPPGTYDVEASIIGYRSQIKKEVKVFADRTTYLNFELQTTVIEIDEPVIVYAKKPVIEIDMTSKETRITRTQLEMLPIEKPIEAITLQGGVTTDAGGNLHIRGGRSDELSYYIDGIEISNALVSITPFIHKDIISEMSFLSGTFNAEYGDIMSGVVNIVTPEGGSSLSGKFEYVSYMLNPSQYRKADWIDSASDVHRDSIGNSMYTAQDIKVIYDLPFLGEINASLAGPIPFDKNTRLFISSQYINQNSYLPFGYELIRTINGKLSKKLSTNLKLFTVVQYTDNEIQNYHHRYKYLFENYLVNNTKSLRTIVGVNHAPTNFFFYNIRVSYLEDNLTTKVPDLSDDTIIEPVYDNYSEFYISGYPVFRQSAITKQYITKADMTLQAWKIHNVKFGIENNFYRFSFDKCEQLFARGPLVYQDYQRKPIDGTLFLQDKIEHKYVVINAGLRFDYNYPDAFMWEDIEDPTSATLEVEPSYQISPRLGLSHPITENSMLHFAYGHFHQKPPYSIMYFNSNYISYPESIPRYGLVGNPRIQPQTTIAYEVGIKYALREIYGIDITLFRKDIKKLLATTEVRIFPYDYIIYTNDDFGSVQGIDVTIKRDIVSRFGFNINYTYQIARGNRSFAMQGFYDVYTGMPERLKEYYLDFDRRHTLAGNIEIITNNSGGIGAAFKAASGLPYTPYISEGVVVEENSARMGWEYSIDVMIHQGFRIGKINIDLFFKGTNVTDHINPRYVYPKSGQPWDSGEETGGLMGSADFTKDPSHVGPRRVIKAGLRIRVL